MRNIDKIQFTLTEPRNKGVIWAKPVEEGYVLYLFNNGRWAPLKLVDDNGTPSTEDDAAGSGGTETINGYPIYKAVIPGNVFTSTQMEGSGMAALLPYFKNKSVRDIVITSGFYVSRGKCAPLLVDYDTVNGSYLYIQSIGSSISLGSANTQVVFSYYIPT